MIKYGSSKSHVLVDFDLYDNMNNKVFETNLQQYEFVEQASVFAMFAVQWKQMKLKIEFQFVTTTAHIHVLNSIRIRTRTVDTIYTLCVRLPRTVRLLFASQYGFIRCTRELIDSIVTVVI